MNNEETMAVGNPRLNENRPETAADVPGVIVFPPVLFFGAVLLGIALQYLWPVHLGLGWPQSGIGAILVLTGGIIAGGAFRSLRRVGTNIHPGKPTTALVNSGPYRFARNPIYLANSVVYVGLTVLFNAFWPLLTLVPFFLLLHWGMVLREERYLEHKFGDAYLAYKSRVRRWL